MTTPNALNGHPYVLYYKEYTSFKVNHNTLSGENLKMTLVFGFEENMCGLTFVRT
jgi:hypothetical protein